MVWARGFKRQPLAPRPLPRSPPKSLATLGKTPLNLTIPITSRDNQSRQRRYAPTLIEIAGIVIGFIQEC